MSKYLEFTAVKFPDKALLKAALEALGYHKVEDVHDAHLYGYHGDVRPETADIIVRRQYVGGSSNDLGFRRTPEGYVPIVSEYDQGHLGSKHGGDFIIALKRAYNTGVINSLSRKYHGMVTTEKVGQTRKVYVRT